MLLPKDLQTLRDMEPRVFDGSMADGFEIYLKNNLAQNTKKGSPRTELQVRSDTAKGIGFEQILLKTGLFTSVSGAMEDPSQMSYSLRQKDLFYHGNSIQVKTITRLHGISAYLTKSMLEKIGQSISLNDWFLFGLASFTNDGQRDLGDTIFTFEPAFIITSETLKVSIVQNEGNYINLDRLYRRPDHYQSLHKSLYEDE